MTRDEAINSLNSDASHTRLKAARELARVASVSDLALLRGALRKEPVSFVRRALEQAVAKVSNGQAPTSEPPKDVNPRTDVEPQAYARAVTWVTNAILHEISPHLGQIRLEARRSVPDYDASALKRRVDALSNVLAGVEELRKATNANFLTIVNLFDLVQSITKDEAVPKGIEVSLQGPRELGAVADENLLRLAICNGFRNAVEATAATGTGSPLVVAWGTTDIDHWVTILDHGHGLSGPPEAAFEIGSTTKSGHRGFGLAIARQAMMTLDGNVSLQPAASGGARFEVRWFK